MDIEQLEVWTRHALEAEAIRRGIRDPHLRGHRELVREILRNEFAGPLARGRKGMVKGLFVLGQARELMGSTAAVVASSLLPTVRSIYDAGVDAVRQGTRNPEMGHEPPWETTPQWVDEEEDDDDGDDGLGYHDEYEHQPTELQASVLAEDVDRERATPSLRRRGFVVPPVRNLAVARILAAQGHREAALDVYEEVCQRHPLDPVPRLEAQALRGGQGLPSWCNLTLPSSPPSAPSLVMGGDHIAWEVAEPDETAVLRWHVTDSGQERARAALGQAGELVLRLVWVRPDLQTVIRTEVEELVAIDVSGEHRVPTVEQDARCVAAIGLRAEGRFVAIAHARHAAAGGAASAMAQPALGVVSMAAGLSGDVTTMAAVGSAC